LELARYTNSTLADQAGLSVAERQRILGHSSSAMTMRYTHAELETMRERMEKIGKKTIN
jgi:integrase